MNSPNPSRSRAETKQATRQALLEAGLAEFLEKGPDGPSLDAICARAGYTRGAFYVHFQDREQFYAAAMEWALREILDALIGAPENDEPLLDSITRYMQFARTAEMPAPLQRRLPLHRVIDAAVRFPAVRANFGRLVDGVIDRIASRIARGRERGELDAPIDPRSAAALIVLMGFGTLVLDAGGARLELREVMRIVESALQVRAPARGPAA